MAQAHCGTAPYCSKWLSWRSKYACSKKPVLYNKFHSSPHVHRGVPHSTELSSIAAATARDAEIGHDSSVRTRRIPTYGSLNSKPHLYYLSSLSSLQLHHITQTAPDNFRRKIEASASTQVLLDEVFRLRQVEATQLPATVRSHTEHAHQLAELSPSEIIQLSQRDCALLRQMMTSALTLDPSLTPRILPDENILCATYAVSWKPIALQQVHQARQQINMPSVSTPPAPNNTTAPPQNSVRLPQPDSYCPLENLLTQEQPQPLLGAATELSDDDDDELQLPNVAKRKKLSLNPKGWTAGHGPAMKSKLQQYPGKGMCSTALAAKEILGPELLLHMIAGGTDIPTYIHGKAWTRSYNNKPLPAVHEAFTLARMIHLEMLVHPTPREALQSRPSIEVGIRRLYALIHVELASKQTAIYQSRAQAWAEIEPILEVLPTHALHSPSVADTITKHMSVHRKRIQALKALSSNTNPRPLPPSRAQNAHPNKPTQLGHHKPLKD